MPRDISGNYTLPVGNPVVDGTIIDVGWANPTMADIAVQLNNVLTLDGVLPATAPIKFATGSAAAPSITFNADPALGIYRGGTNILGFATAGVSRGTISATGNWSIPAPSSGSAFVIAGGGASPGLGVTGTAAQAAIITVVGNGAALSTGLALYQDGTQAGYINQIANQPLSFYTNNTLRLTVAAAGNVTIAAPSSGVALTVSAASTISAIGVFGSTQLHAGYLGASRPTLLSTGTLDIGTTGLQDISFFTNGSSRTTITSTGNVTIAAPSSGNTLTVNTVSTSSGFAAVGTAATGLEVVHASGNTTGYIFSDWINTSGQLRWGVESSAGGVLFSGSAAYSSIIGTQTATSFHIGTNSAVRVTIASTGKTTFSGGVLTASSAVAFSATPAFDANLSNYFDLGTLTGNVTGATITNPTAGQTITIRVKQDATGSRTFAVSTASKITGSVQATLSTASLLTLTYNGTDSRWEGSWLGLPV
jgi:fibronectin-binding autotransporter adhesin